MRIQTILNFILPVIIVSSCISGLKRYRSLETPAFDSTLADADLFSSRIITDAPSGKSETLLGLTADAQSQFIKILNMRYPDNAQFLNALKYKFSIGDSLPDKPDYVRKKLKLVISVSRRRDYSMSGGQGSLHLTPADRIEYLRLSLVLDEPCLKFTGWNMYATEYGTIDIGDVSFSKGLGSDLSSSVPVKSGENRGNIALGISPSVTRKEDQKVSYRYVKLNGRLNDTMLVMEEEGTRETDLAGNIIADVSVRFTGIEEYVASISNLYDSTGKHNPPDKLIFERILSEIPYTGSVKKQIGAKLIIDYIYRNVVAGSRTFPEWDDRVKYFTGHREKNVTLLNDVAYVPGFYGIGLGQGDSRKEFVTVEASDGTSFRLIFRTYEEASEFLSWMKEWLSGNDGIPVVINDNLLKFRAVDLTGKILENESGFGVVPYFW